MFAKVGLMFALTKLTDVVFNKIEGVTALPETLNNHINMTKFMAMLGLVILGVGSRWMREESAKTLTGQEHKPILKEN